MITKVGIHNDETMEVLAELRAEKAGVIIAVFVDRAGDNVVLRLTASVARDLHDNSTNPSKACARQRRLCPDRAGGRA